MMQLREDIINALMKRFEGEISAHKVNVEIMLENTVGVGENTNITETIEKDLEIIAGFEDKLNALKKHFKDSNHKKKEVING